MSDSEMSWKSSFRAFVHRSLFVVLIGVAAQTPLFAQSLPDEIGEDEYAVASAALLHFSNTFLRGARTLVVDQQTWADDRLQTSVNRIRQPEPEKPKEKEEDPTLRRPVNPEKTARARRLKDEWAQMTLQNSKAFADAVSDETVQDWRGKSHTACLWAGQFQVGMPVFVLSKDEFKNLQGSSRRLKDFWSAFDEKYPEAGAVVMISRVGFNSTHTQAVIEVGYQTGPVGGEGDFVLLEKENGAWKVKFLLGAWLS